ncbi:MAG: transketolase [Oscillospiraceae bacterium]
MNDNKRLGDIAQRIRIMTTGEIANLGVGHIGGCLSIIEILTVLYFEAMNIDPKEPKRENRDRFVLSKGHAGPALYATLACRGYFPVEMLKTLNAPGTLLPSHCDMLRTPGIDMTAGSLGQGISAAVGIAIAQKLKRSDNRVFAIIGDGESQEGQVWESAMYASQRKLDNLTVFTDLNGLQVDGFVDSINSLGEIEKKWNAFGWNVLCVDGHDPDMISLAIKNAKEYKGKPTMIIAHTVKAKGIASYENAENCHNVALPSDKWDEILEKMGRE